MTTSRQAVYVPGLGFRLASMVSPNEILKGNSFYVSYNNHDIDIYGDATTALVIGQGEKFFILNGDHRKQYEALIQEGLEVCVDYFRSNIECINKTSAQAPDPSMQVRKNAPLRQIYCGNYGKSNLNRCVVTGKTTEGVFSGVPFNGGNYGDGQLLIWCAANEPDLLDEKQRVAVDFYHRLKASLTPQQWLKVREGNAAQTNSDVCHSRDECDANVHMLDSYIAVIGDDDLSNEDAMSRFTSTANAAWPTAKILMVNSLSYAPEEPPVRNQEAFGNYSFRLPAYAIVDAGTVVDWSRSKKCMQAKLELERSHGSLFAAEIHEYKRLPPNLVAVQPALKPTCEALKKTVEADSPMP